MTVYTQSNPCLNARVLPKAKRLQEKSSFHIRSSHARQKLENLWARYCKTKKPIELNICKLTNLKKVFDLIKIKISTVGNFLFWNFMTSRENPHMWNFTAHGEDVTFKTKEKYRYFISFYIIMSINQPGFAIIDFHFHFFVHIPCLLCRCS